MSWVTDFWKVLETAATLTSDVGRARNEIQELRRDVNSLTLTVSQLKSDFAHEKATTKLVLDNHANDARRLKESIDSKFDVLITRLDSKLAAFENRMPSATAEENSPPSLNSDLDD